MPGGAVTEADPYGDEALTFVKEMIMQREVEIEVESIGKYSTFTLVNLKNTLEIVKSTLVILEITLVNIKNKLVNL